MGLMTPCLAVTITREKADELMAQLRKDPWLVNKDASQLAWGEAAVLNGIVDMYEATGDPKYLRALVQRGDQMLSHRDDRRRVKDWTGKVHKAWSMGVKYTVAEGTLRDASGRDIIRLRSTPYAYNDQTRVQVTVKGRVFALKVTNEYWKRSETFANLSTDPKSPRYFEKIINNPSPTPGAPAGGCTEISQLIKARPLVKDSDLPRTQQVTLKSLKLAYVGYLGIIYYPLLRFAEIVKADESLKEFLPAADRFTTAADESYEEAKSHFRNGPGKDEGYYITCERGGPFPYDNLPEPFNYLGMHVSSELALYRLTGKAFYLDQATRMANLFKNRLELVNGDRYVWYYWYEPLTTGYSHEDDLSDNYPAMPPKPVIEDNSHATLNIQLVLNAERAGVVFDKTDLRRFANTFLMNIYRRGETTFNARVDGSEGADKYDNVGITGWLPLAEVDPAVYDACRAVYVGRGSDSFTSIARLLKWEKLLSNRSQKADTE
jgi:hypothetical protein